MASWTPQRLGANILLPSRAPCLRGVRQSTGSSGLARSARRSETHLSYRANWLRAAVLGANDGIVSTASLVLGVAASGSSGTAIVTAGIAGLVAGALSMAAGEYVSVSSQRDSEAADLRLEEHELSADPAGSCASSPASTNAEVSRPTWRCKLPRRSRPVARWRRTRETSSDSTSSGAPDRCRPRGRQLPHSPPARFSRWWQSASARHRRG